MWLALRWGSGAQSIEQRPTCETAAATHAGMRTDPLHTSARLQLKPSLETRYRIYVQPN